jgi:NAD+ synthase
MSQRTDAIVEWLRQRLNQAGARGFVIGLSGGVDSAVVARLCQAAAPVHVVAVLMPCHSDPQDEADALLTAEHFRIPVIRLDLTPVYDPLSTALRQALAAIPPEQFPDPAHAVDDVKVTRPFANLKPRLRMTTLYAVANALDYLVAGTGNRSELAIGSFTKHGEGAVDVLPIGDLLESEVRAVAKELGVPEPIIDKASSAGPGPGENDEAEMGFSYAALEKYLNTGAETVSPALAMRIERLMRTSEHKRALPPTPGAKT